MARRVYDQVELNLGALDRLVVDELRAAGGFLSDADLLRTALVNQARLMGIEVPSQALRVRGRRDPRARQSA